MSTIKNVLKEVCSIKNWGYSEYSDNIILINDGNIIVFWMNDSEVNIQFVSDNVLQIEIAQIIIQKYRDPLHHFNFQIQSNKISAVTAISSSIFYGSNSIEYVKDDISRLLDEFKLHIKVINKVIDSL